jgi:UrcA family protein
MTKFLTTALLGLSLLSGVADAERPTPNIRIEYRDLDLKNPLGVARLDHRIEKALTALCPNDRPADLTARIEERHCRAAKLAEIAPQRERVLAGGLARPVAVAAN